MHRLTLLHTQISPRERLFKLLSLKFTPRHACSRWQCTETVRLPVSLSLCLSHRYSEREFTALISNHTYRTKRAEKLIQTVKQVDPGILCKCNQYYTHYNIHSPITSKVHVLVHWSVNAAATTESIILPRKPVWDLKENQAYRIKETNRKLKREKLQIERNNTPVKTFFFLIIFILKTTNHHLKSHVCESRLHSRVISVKLAFFEIYMKELFGGNSETLRLPAP